MLNDPDQRQLMNLPILSSLPTEEERYCVYFEHLFLFVNSSHEVELVLFPNKKNRMLSSFASREDYLAFYN